MAGNRSSRERGASLGLSGPKRLTVSSVQCNTQGYQPALFVLPDLEDLLDLVFFVDFLLFVFFEDLLAVFPVLFLALD